MKYGIVFILTPYECQELGNELEQRRVFQLAKMTHAALIRKLRKDNMLKYCEVNGAKLEIYLKDLTKKDRAKTDKYTVVNNNKSSETPPLLTAK